MQPLYVFVYVCFLKVTDVAHLHSATRHILLRVADYSGFLTGSACKQCIIAGIHQRHLHFGGRHVGGRAGQFDRHGGYELPLRPESIVIYVVIGQRVGEFIYHDIEIIDIHARHLAFPFLAGHHRLRIVKGDTL